MTHGTAGMRPRMRSMAVGVAMLCMPAMASAAPKSADPALQATLDEIGAARAADPAAFQVVERVVQQVLARPPPPEHMLDVARQFQALGPGALLPMLELLLPGHATLAGAEAKAQAALTLGMLEALKTLKDARAVPLLKPFVDGTRNAHPRAPLVAAAAIGAVCRDQDVTFLVGQAGAGQRNWAAATAGLGYCRRRSAAGPLLAALDPAVAEPQVAAAAGALGWMGSSWATEAVPTAERPELEAIRMDASRRLVRVFVKRGGDARVEAGRALRMIQHPAALPLLAEAARGADAATMEDVKDLQSRLKP